MVQDITSSGVAAGELRQFVERVERVNEERDALADDLRDIYAEAKGRGFDVKALKKIISMRRKSPTEREEEDAMVALYCDALGMEPPTTLPPSAAPKAAKVYPSGDARNL